jgi:hypothetical protein
MLPQGIAMTLMVGPAVPVPVPKVVLEALQSVRVTTSTSGPSGFQLTFTLAKGSPLNTLFLVSGGATIPLLRVIVAVTLRGQTTVLMDGVMTEHEVSPGERPGQLKLTVTGEDLTRVMDYIEFDGFPFPAMPAEARVLVLLAKYAFFGILPLIIPSVLTDVPIPVERIPRQQGTDLAYIRQLAEEVGHIFYLDPGPVPGTNVGYWGPEIKVGPLQPALNLDMDTHTNVESLSFRFDSQARKLPILWLHEKLTKVPIPIPIPDISPLNPPLGLVPPLPKQIAQIPGMAKRSPPFAALKGMAEAAKSSEAVRGSGSLDVLRYGRVLRARQLVGVRGAGDAFDGAYYVDSVTHELRRGSYKQSFELTRNGLVSLLPKVPA